MKRRPVKFFDGCGLLFQEGRPNDGDGRWVEAGIYFSALWSDLG
jgi:hypothetical protein